MQNYYYKIIYIDAENDSIEKIFVADYREALKFISIVEKNTSIVWQDISATDEYAEYKFDNKDYVSIEKCIFRTFKEI